MKFNRTFVLSDSPLNYFGQIWSSTISDSSRIGVRLESDWTVRQIYCQSCNTFLLFSRCFMVHLLNFCNQKLAIGQKRSWRRSTSCLILKSKMRFQFVLFSFYLKFILGPTFFSNCTHFGPLIHRALESSGCACNVRSFADEE